MTTDSVREWNPYMIAGTVDCTSPDNQTSPGALWLCAVRDDAVEWWDNADPFDRTNYDQSDSAHELADNAVPIYTHDKWRVFVDLAAYTEDLDDIGGTSGDMDQDSNLALYLIASRVVAATLAALELETEDEDDTDD